MSHFSLLGPRTSRSHHEDDSTADGEKKIKWRIRKIFTNKTMIILSVLCCAKSLQLCLTLWDPMNPHQAPLSLGFSSQGYWSELPCPPPKELPNLGTEPVSLCLLHWQASSYPLAPPGKPTMYLNITKTEVGQVSLLDAGGLKIQL